MKAQILPYEHRCVDGCGEVLERRGTTARVCRYFLRRQDGKTNGLFGSAEQARAFADKYGIEIDADSPSAR